MDLRSQPHVKDRGKLGTRIGKPANKPSFQEPQYHPPGPPVTSLPQAPQYTDPGYQQYSTAYTMSPQPGYGVPGDQQAASFGSQQPGYFQQPEPFGQPQQPGGFPQTTQAGGFQQQPPQSNYYNQQAPLGFPNVGSSFLQDPMVASMAVSYGQTFLGQGREKMEEKIGQYVSVSQLKYYFAVDTNYVLKKLGLLFFPFLHKDWSIRYNNEEPVQPRHEINAPDLYIPVMAFVTYVLASGLVLGIQQRFSPEHLGVQASSALIWLILELAVISLTIYIGSIKTQLNSYHLLSICSYKFVGMIVSLLASIPLASTGYYACLFYCSAALAFFMVRSLKTLVLCENQDETYQTGRKRSMYLLLLIGGLQPVMMFWLTWKLATFQVPSSSLPPLNGPPS